ncbi:TRP-domain-containing protein [Byssothecium circinans]|uniref:TRP-domain-containing protein n=1 Tax=Byssothecium circinans TaxID=147558 RepID=A0A6A5TFJ5_9PLEO|nr:TRP-domain-containing protein [Byssothecium circinans]
MIPSLSQAVALLAAASLPLASAAIPKERMIETRSLNPCMTNSSFSAQLFNVVFTPNNRTLTYDVEGYSNIDQKVTAELELLVYGLSAMKQDLNPCGTPELASMCPMKSGSITINSNLDISADVMSNIPGIAYTIPDLDAAVRIKISDSQTKTLLACVEAELSNGHTVQQKAVSWVTAVIASLGLMASAITSGLGHSNTAAHVAANAMSLFGFFQAQALLGMVAVSQPPIVAAWTQNFQWTMGIIRVGFLQDMATWYQRATGGTPTTFLSQLNKISIEVQKKMKRDVLVYTRDAMAALPRGISSLLSRSNADTTSAMMDKRVVLHGIKRVGFKARMETTNIFFTGYCFFVIFVLLVVIGVVAFKFICEALVKAGKMRSDQFTDFRNGWQTVLKGILFRVILISFPQMMVLCLWELTVRDSAGEVVLAVFTLVTMICILAWASSKVVRIAQRSIAMHKNPAYILYSDPSALNKWGFLYVQFKAAMYYCIIPVLIYILIKAMFIGLVQNNGGVQAVALLLIETGLLIGVCVLRPYMDKKTNGFNIAIAAVNWTSAFFMLFFSEIFKTPGIVPGAMGVIFFILNAAFALVLLLMVLISSGFALFTKNPDTRYQPMRDDRGSFIKSQTQLTTELDALGATARGEGKGQHSRIDDDDDLPPNNMATKEAGFSEHYQPTPPRSPVPQTQSSYGANNNVPAGNPPSYYSRNSPPAAPQGAYGRAGSLRNEANYRSANNASPWQRGAGYDH